MSVAATTRSAVTRLRLYHFRNYDQTVIELGPDLNVIAGRNAQGKTNLLEALATLTLTRSPRSATAGDVMTWGELQCAVEASVARGSATCVLGLRLEREADGARVARTTMIDGKPRPARALLGVCPVVMFWPEDLQLVKAGPDGRRRALDVILAQLDSRAAAHLLRFRRVLEQRNALLHRMHNDGARGGGAALAGFTKELAHHGARVCVARSRLLDDLAPLATAALAELTRGSEHITLRYAPSHGGPCHDDDSTEQALVAALDERRAEELARGVTVAGPHRDDVDILLDGRPARTTASQGQQRSIVLAWKLAEVRHVARCTGTAPVVMLDDVLSELDPRRRAELLTLLAGGDAAQVLVTTTEPLPSLHGFASVRHFTVAAGTVTRGE